MVVYFIDINVIVFHHCLNFVITISCCKLHYVYEFVAILTHDAIVYITRISLSSQNKIFSVCIPHRFCNETHTTGATSAGGTTYPSGVHPACLGVSVAQSWVFSVEICRSFFCLLTTELTLHPFTASDYPFGTFNLFLYIHWFPSGGITI